MKFNSHLTNLRFPFVFFVSCMLSDGSSTASELDPWLTKFLKTQVVLANTMLSINVVKNRSLLVLGNQTLQTLVLKRLLILKSNIYKHSFGSLFLSLDIIFIPTATRTFQASYTLRLIILLPLKRFHMIQ